MENNDDFTTLFNDSLKELFSDARKISLKNPLQAAFFLKTLNYQKKAIKLREGWEDKGVHVPPFAIFSVTGRCNLHCKGCYAKAQHPFAQKELGTQRVTEVLTEARKLGISIILLAGGEPFVRNDLLDITGKFPEIIFPIFTNGLLINEDLIKKLKNQRNVIPVVSIEGYEGDTDARRGKGVYEYLRGIIEKLKSKEIFFGVSITMTSNNLSDVTGKEFILKLIDLGCKLFFFVEYVPIEEGTESWTLTYDQRMKALNSIEKLRSELPGLFIAFPGDEEESGGCVSAGRGFVHISAEGDLEPCPFAPYSDTNVRDMSLKEALQSNFLKKIRENHENLKETSGGCALWLKRDWVRSVLEETKLSKR